MQRLLPPQQQADLLMEHLLMLDSQLMMLTVLMPRHSRKIGDLIEVVLLY
jgi:hypothetical protein